jgi:hypothetical protein
MGEALFPRDDTLSLRSLRIGVEVNEIELPRFTSEIERGDCDRQAKAARTGAAGIDVKDTIAFGARGPVRMAADHDVKSGRGRIQVKLVAIVEHVNLRGIGFDGSRNRQLCRPWLGIHIPAYGNDGSQSSELVYNFRPANVSRVDDQVGTF